MEEMERCGRPRWYRFVDHKNMSDWILACRELQVDGTKGTGKGRKTPSYLLSLQLKVKGTKGRGLRAEVERRRTNE